MYVLVNMFVCDTITRGEVLNFIKLNFVSYCVCHMPELA